MTNAPNILTVLGYNTHLFVDTIVAASSKQTYHDGERINKIIGKIKEIGPDIVGLCEVWANSSKDKFISGLKNILPYSCYDDNNNPFQMGSGLLLLSRHHIDWHNFIRYTDLTSWDVEAQKGFLIATVLINGDRDTKLAIVLTHANSGGYFDEGSPAAIARSKNFLQIRDWLKLQDTVSWYTPRILLGDMNVDAFHPEYQHIFVSTFFPFNIIDSYVDQTTCDPGYTVDEINNKLNQKFSPGGNSQMRIDYMFIGSDERCPVRGVCRHGVNVLNDFKFTTSEVMDLSDHYPLYGAFDVRFSGAYGVQGD
jgi:endonuclease/exonuclease/phosphatase family metal-dependent hydrolase